MRLSDSISEEFVCLELQHTTKAEAIKELAELLRTSRHLKDFDAYLKAVLEREEVGTTGIGDGIAIPHARTDTVVDFVVAVGRSTKGIEFDSVDGKPVNLMILMGTPLGKLGEYLRVLAHLCYLLKRKGFFESVMQAPDIAAVVKLFRSNESG